MSYRSRTLLASVLAATLALAACDSNDEPVDRNDNTLNRNIDSTTTTPGGTQTDRPYGDPSSTTYPSDTGTMEGSRQDTGGAAGGMDRSADGMSDGSEGITTPQ